LSRRFLGVQCCDLGVERSVSVDALGVNLGLSLFLEELAVEPGLRINKSFSARPEIEVAIDLADGSLPGSIGDISPPSRARIVVLFNGSVCDHVAGVRVADENPTDDAARSIHDETIIRGRFASAFI